MESSNFISRQRTTEPNNLNSGIDSMSKIVDNLSIQDLR